MTKLADDLGRAFLEVCHDLGRGFVELKPQSWRRELTYWVVVYGVLAALLGLPPF
jgi:hypothetical protein